MNYATIRNEAELTLTNVRRDALRIAEAGYAAVATDWVIRKDVLIEGSTLKIRDHVYSLEGIKNIYVVGVGKCAASAAAALEAVLGDRLTGGIILDAAVPDRCPVLQKIACFVGTHPKPSVTNIEATKAILAFLDGKTSDDLIIAIVSGGGSTLLCQPNDEMTCVDESMLFDELTHHGATIQELNTVRKHTSLARGGRLAARAYPARVVSLIFSDVPGNDVMYIASGPTIKDITTIPDARAVIAKYGVQFNESYFIETPKEEKYFERVDNILFVTNMTALEGMKAEAEKMGYKAEIVSDHFTGEASEVGRQFALDLQQMEPGSVRLYGGETTVTVKGSAGKGGRNQELALAALSQIQEGHIVVSFGSDGHDNSDFAGALCDTMVASHARERGLNPEEFLQKHDSYTFFEQTGDALITGYTGSNVSDLIIVLKTRTQ